MASPFVHLRVHTEFSIVDGLIRIKPLMNKLVAQNMQAVAITDYCNLFAVVKVFKAAVKVGIKPILGCELPCYDSRFPEHTFSLLLLCQNDLGYRNLTCLVSKAYQEGQFLGKPRIDLAWIEDYADGLIALSGGMRGVINHSLLVNDFSSATLRARQLMAFFPDRLYLEIQRTGRSGEQEYNQQLLVLSRQLHLPLVATNDVCFLNEDDFMAHETRVAIHQGYMLAESKRYSHYISTQYLRSSEDMQALFADLPEAITNTTEIAKRCNVKLNLGNTYLPNFPTPSGISIETHLETLSKEGLEKKFSYIFPHETKELIAAKRKPYDERLALEIDVINKMGFAGYFLIVADFIHWAKNNDVPVGPGRGSGVGSLVAYALEITDLDPLRYKLLFERFLNPERVSMPDFDIDFCMEGRDSVIEYVAEKYGRQSVSQIITFGTMAAKAVLRDVGRVQGHPYGFVDKLAKLVPFEIGMTLNKALSEEKELKRRYEDEEEVRELIDLALKLEGLTRNAGKHAGGVVIAPSRLTDFTALYCEQDSTQIVSQLDKDDVEAAGLVKFDFLGLRTLTIIHWAILNINKKRSVAGQPLLDIRLNAMDDAKTFALLKACQTTAVFQLESRGMKDLIHRLQPDCFEDIVALVALFRPGPLQSGMVDDFINRKHGLADTAYPHPDLEPVLKATYGVILYQEQVMQIAQVLANYTLGGADLLRRAMGKKKPEEMAKQRTIFMEGALARGVSEDIASHVFDLMEKFSGYGFNKSHAAAYALLSYQTAWLKAHHTDCFMAAVLSSDMDNTDKVVNFIEDCKLMKLKVCPPHINFSYYQFTVPEKNTILYGLGAIKGVGESAIECIIEARETQGIFTSLFDFCQRLDLRKVNRRALEALIKSGAMDAFGMDRAVLQASLEDALNLANKTQESHRSGQQNLFDLLELDDNVALGNYIETEPWPELTRLQGEKETLGYYLTGHPTTVYFEEFKKKVFPIACIDPRLVNKSIVCVLILAVRKVLTKKNKLLTIIRAEDGSGKIDILMFSDEYIQVGQIMVFEGEISVDNFSGGLKMNSDQFWSIEQARTVFIKSITLDVTFENQPYFEAIKSLLKQNEGQCSVKIRYTGPKAGATLMLGDTWRVSPNDDFITKLRHLLGENKVMLYY